MKNHARALIGLLAFASTLVVADASADPFPARADRIMSPGRMTASEDSAEALVLNPANLANMTGLEGRWTWVRCPDTKVVGCGHSFELAAPLLWGLATGLRVDYVTPPSGPSGVGFPFNGVDYTWITWGFGHKVSDRLQVGGSVQWSYSSNPYTDGLFGLTAAASYRMFTRFGVALVAHDFNGPSLQPLPPSGFPLLGRNLVAAATFRPTGKRNIEVALEGRWLPDGVDQLRPRAVAAIDIPGVGRIRGDVEVMNLGNDATRGVLATAGAEIYFSALSAGGGALFGNALGSAQSAGQYATISFNTTFQPGIPRPQHAVYIRMESTPGNRAHVRLLRSLWKLAEEKDVAAVTMVMRSEPATSYAHAEELADAFRVLKARGKKVICSFEDAGPKALYACASADRVVINPAGGVRYSGLKTQHMYLAGLLKKLGVKAEFVRIGAHKAAPEQFMNERSSDVARADQEDLLRQHEAVFTRNMELYRKIPADQFRVVSSKGPFVASEAREAKLVDGFAFDDELERVTQDVVGKKVSYEKLAGVRKASPYFGPRPRVGLLYVDGDIIDGRSRNVPLIDTKLVGSYTIAEAVKSLRENDSIKAVVLRIESPGGSSMASDVMWRELKKLAEKKPLVVSMGSVAASGGYYVASPAKTIYALPLTITGSIGIFYGKADISELLGKVGVNIETRRTTARADAESIFRGFTDDERAELNHKVRQFYDVFLDRVAQGRHMTKEQVDAVGQGRVWAGQQALEKKLVDKMGGLRHALEEARALANLPPDAPIDELPTVPQSLLDYALSLAGFKAGSSITLDELPVQVREVLRGIAPMALYGDGESLARMEWVPLEDTIGVEDDDAFAY
ncbi:MAG: signal peptide peptidase SppA [Labilithrix sp.]|nr:signal peptide peptidase SppA [Labilithrix sp.]MCW5811683.1 signal peptide peptidase SppA [Labilithrix sp.]